MASLAAIAGIGKWIIGEVSSWSERRDKIKHAETMAHLEEIRARGEIAAYKVKSDIEWDLKWADQAAASWKDEFILILWAIPLIGLFIPPLRPFVMEGFEYLKSFHPTAPQWYMAGWSIIFAATFGFKWAAKLMLPGKIGQMATALSSIPDDIPDEVVDGYHERRTEERPAGLY